MLLILHRTLNSIKVYISYKHWIHCILVPAPAPVVEAPSTPSPTKPEKVAAKAAPTKAPAQAPAPTRVTPIVIDKDKTVPLKGIQKAMVC